MSSYAQSLRNQTTTDPDITFLQAYANTHATSWPWWSDSKADYEQHIDTNETNVANNARLKNALNTSFSAWLNANNPMSRTPVKQQVVDFFVKNIVSIIVSFIGLLLAFALLWGLFNTRFFTSIAGIEQARGLITFLFAFSTMGIIVLIAVAIFWLQHDELEDRFARAKDLLTIVIGVLGTILGFYFGSVSEGENRARVLNIANVGVSSPVAQATSTVKLSATILGGAPPYTYSIQFTDPTGTANTSTMAVKSETSDTGAIAKDVVVPPDISKPTSITFTMLANDTKGAQAHASSAIVVVPKAAQ
jgi:hypothetical protein